MMLAPRHIDAQRPVPSWYGVRPAMAVACLLAGALSAGHGVSRASAGRLCGSVRGKTMRANTAAWSRHGTEGGVATGAPNFLKAWVPPWLGFWARLAKRWIAACLGCDSTVQAAQPTP
ncbi:MAG: hypothetical protein IPH54_22305 [Rhodoferax sp.]|nr:hypothetical protein [Rhodoferax sp.]